MFHAVLMIYGLDGEIIEDPSYLGVLSPSQSMIAFCRWWPVTLNSGRKMVACCRYNAMNRHGLMAVLQFSRDRDA